MVDPLAAFVAETAFDAIPPPVVAQAKLVVLDTLGVLLAASTEPEPTELARLAAIEGGGGPSTIVRAGFPSVAPLDAAFVNGTTGVFLEMDEGHRFFTTHAAMHVVPAALAVAEQQGNSGQEFLLAVILGYEAAARTGGATRARPVIQGHGTWGTVGAAAACAKLLKLSSSETTSALRLAAHLAVATAYRTCIEGATVRNVYVGMAAQSGVRAAQLARAAFTGLVDAPSEVFGKVLGDAFDSRVLTDELGTRFEITRGFFKLYACCQWNHAALDALEEILTRSEAITHSDIEAAQVRTFFPATTMCATRPVNSLQAKFSLPYALAARLVYGHAGPDAFQREALSDPRVLELASRVEIVEVPAFTAAYPTNRSAEVVLRTRAGLEYRARCENARGDFMRPHPRAALEAKYRRLAGTVLTGGAVEALAGVVERLEDARAASELIEAMRAGKGVACPA